MTTGRLELKYCVPDSVAAYVLEIAKAHLVPEPLADGPRQRITSLYLDTADLQFLRWHRERVPDRFKLRIRRYGELPARPGRWSARIASRFRPPSFPK
jgi:VTC domain-containing protein